MGPVTKGQDLPGIIVDNPEKFYTFGEDIGSGKFSMVKKVTHKLEDQEFAAKIIYFDEEDALKFPQRELAIMQSDAFKKCTGVAQLKEAYVVRKYVIIIMDLVDGKTILDGLCHRNSVTEEDVAVIIKNLCTILAQLNEHKIVHLDIRPTNIRFAGRDVKLLDYNSMCALTNSKSGAVVDTLGDTEFCPPEMLNFDNVMPESDMWSVAVIMYIMLSGISPFFYEDENEVLRTVQSVKYTFAEDEFSEISSEAKDFIKKCFLRAPEMRMDAAKALQHKWLSDGYEGVRKKIVLPQLSLDQMEETDARLLSEEEEDYVYCSCVFRTFDEEEYDTPDEESDGDE